jgi:hypothetical protein
MPNFMIDNIELGDCLGQGQLAGYGVTAHIAR